MGEIKYEKLEDTYRKDFKIKYYEGRYAEASKLLIENPGLDNYLTQAQAVGIIRYLLEKNNSDIKTMKSSLEKTLDKIDNMENN